MRTFFDLTWELLDTNEKMYLLWYDTENWECIEEQLLGEIIELNEIRKCR